jgi:hypothetical protein
VNAPASWPNNSLSSSSAGIAGGIERDEGAMRARRFAMQRARDELLARAGLAGDQHRQRRLREPPDAAEQLAHRGRVADQVGVGEGRRRRRRARGRERRRIRHRTAGEFDRRVEVERLGQEFVGATAKGAGGAGDVGVSAHDDHGQLRRGGLQAIQQHQAVFARHAHVGEQQRGRAAIAQRLQCIARILEAVDRIPGFAQCGGEHEAHRAIVVDDPDAGGHRCGFRRHPACPLPSTTAAAG